MNGWWERRVQVALRQEVGGYLRPEGIFLCVGGESLQR